MHIDNQYNEKRLLQLSAMGDETAFTRVFHFYKHKLYSFLIRLTESPEMTEDVIQDIFLKLWKNRAGLTTIDNFSSYIFRMGQNQCISHFKRSAKETLILAELQKDLAVSSSETDGYLATKEVQQKLHEAIGKLSKQQKLVYTLSREQGLKHEEIARHLNISISTVKNHMIDALRILRKQVYTHPTKLGVSCFLAIITAFEK